MTLMLIKYQSLKKKNMVDIICLNALLGIMIMVLLTIIFRAFTNDWIY